MAGETNKLLVKVVLALVLAAGLLGHGVPAGAQDAPAQPVRYCHPVTLDDGKRQVVCIGEADFHADACGAIAAFARAWRLPEAFFARLIWQESRFDPNALSTAGAEGIAQFMPSTGAIRGLRNAFDPAEALAKSAEYLRFLTDKYGNLGLAAAAYNGGEGRMSRYVRSGGYLPNETEDYVAIITGVAVDAWRAEVAPSPDYRLRSDLRFEAACVEMAKAAPMPRLDLPPGEWKPWGVLIAQDFSQARARRIFERVREAHADLLGGEDLMLLTGRNRSFGTRLRHNAMIGRDTREDAQALCRALTAEGGVCLVKKSNEP
jgi:hypothetical protein